MPRAELCSEDVVSALDIPNDSQIMANDILVPFDNDTVLTVASPISVEGQEEESPRWPPAVGQHTDEVLREAGYDAAMIERLRAGRSGRMTIRASNDSEFGTDHED